MACFSEPSPEQVRQEREDLETIVRLACMYCREQESHGWKVPEFARSWWRRHKKDDAKREAAEQRERRKEAIAHEARAKLTQEEREALGIR
jgi:hypothetical protein